MQTRRQRFVAIKFATGCRLAASSIARHLSPLELTLLRQRDRPRSAHRPALPRLSNPPNDLRARRQTRTLRHQLNRSATRRRTNKSTRPIPQRRALHPEEGLLPAPHSRPLLPPCNAMLCFRLSSRWPVVSSITKRLTDSMAQQWNLPCGLINREQGFG